MSGKHPSHVFKKYLGHLSFEEMWDKGIIHAGHATEELDVITRGGIRHSCINEEGSDIIRRGKLIEDKYATCRTKYRKSGDVVRERTGFTIGRLYNKVDSPEEVRLSVYVNDLRFNELVCFEFKAGHWEDMVKGNGSGIISVRVRNGVRLTQLNETNTRIAFFDRSRHYVKPRIVK